MSFFSWLSRSLAPPKNRSIAEPSRSWQGDATMPLLVGNRSMPPVPPKTQEQPALRKNERIEQRELLYAVVREAMVSTGVLSSNYKFKVLSLDPKGRQFLVMMDLAREYGGQTIRWNEAEVLIAQTAKVRHGILVTAVYWRINDHVAVGIRQGGTASRSAPLTAQPPPHIAVKPVVGAVAAVPERSVPAASAAGASTGSVGSPVAPAVPVAASLGASGARARPSAPAPLSSAPQRTAPPHEPIEADEVAAFKHALSQAAASSAAPAAAAKPGVTVRSGPLLQSALLTGFEDTEMPEGQTSPPDLGSTQYGELN